MPTMPREVASLFRPCAWTLLFRKSPRLALIMTFCVVMGRAPHVHAQDEGIGEYHVKAAFLYNFAKFVEWPPETMPSGSAPLVLGVVGEDPFGQVLEETIKGKTVNGQELVIRRFTRIQGASGCHILFISSSERKRLAEIIDGLRGSSVLTVSDMERFAQRGGIISFTMENNKVRFEVNLDSAERAGLKISSKLLTLAKIVRDGSRGGKS